MSIPRVQPLLLPVLRMRGDRNKNSVEEIRKRMIGNFKLHNWQECPALS